MLDAFCKGASENIRASKAELRVLGFRLECSESLFWRRSLVKKDAGMLDAFGKGASEDIRASKAELYAQMTWDPIKGRSLSQPPQMTTPQPSPPPSPKPMSKAGSDSGAAQCFRV